MDDFIPDRASRSSTSLRQGAGGRGEPVVESADQTLPRTQAVFTEFDPALVLKAHPLVISSILQVQLTYQSH